MRKLLDMLTAVVDIRITGAYPQDFINRLAAASLPFWGLKRADELTWYLSMYARDYLKIKAPAKKAMCKVHIEKKRGLPFHARKLRGRKTLIGGLALFVAAALILPSFVWTFKVEGNETVPQEQILRALEETGIGFGTLGSSINPALTETRMLLKIPQLSWLTINVSGALATVSVREETPKPEILDEGVITDLVAVNTGIITRMEILRGLPLFEKGMTVLKGQKLVTGVIEHYAFERLFTVQTVRSLGEVYARTWRRQRGLLPTEYDEKAYSGRESKKYSLIMGTKRLNFYNDSGNSYEECDKIIRQHWLTLPGGIVFPLALEEATVREYAPTAAKLDEEAAGELLQEHLRRVVQGAMLGGQIREEDFSFELKNGLADGELLCECEEQIASEVLVTASDLSNMISNSTAEQREE